MSADTRAFTVTEWLEHKALHHPTPSVRAAAVHELRRMAEEAA